MLNKSGRNKRSNKTTRSNSQRSNASPTNKQTSSKLGEKDDNALNVLIENIWNTFDADGSGTLDFEETKNFVSSFMSLAGCDDQFDSSVFQMMFNQYDADQSGSLEKHELK